MATSRKIIKVFLASPGDLPDERQAAKQVVDEFNKQWADFSGTHVELVGWEDTVSKFGRPQDLINRDLDQCEFFIGVMWKHWGSPPSKDSRYTSGFEEEFERAVASRRRSNRPEISLLFKEIEPEFLKDPGEGLRKVMVFQKKIIDEKVILFQRFATLREFEGKIRDCITDYVQSLQAEEAQRIAQQTTSKLSDGSGGAEKSDSAPSPLSSEGASFIREFVKNTERDGGGSNISPAEVARFRLLSTMLGVHGNDPNVLGVHDTNILFSHRNEMVLSVREMRAIVASSLTYITSETAPLWHWYVASDCEGDGYLSLTSTFGQSSEQVGALQAMRLISEPIKPVALFERAEIVALWFHDSADARLKAAALEYLAVCGLAEDLPLIRAEYERGNYQTVGPATDALLRITLRESRDAALKLLNELQPETIPSSLVVKLFSKPDSIDTNLLTTAATHRSSMVRNAAVPILARRGALSPALAEQLLTDSEGSIRFCALRFLAEAGRDYADEALKSILIKPAAATGSPFGLASLGGAGIPDKQGEAFYKKFKDEQLRNLSDSALERIIAAEGIFEREARFARDYKHFRQRGGALRAALDNRFRSLVSADIEQLETKLGADAVTVKKLYSIEEYLRKQFCRQALDIICEKNQAQDLGRVRAAIQEGFVEFSAIDVEYIQRHGEWQDIKLLISLYERNDQGFSLLTGASAAVVESISSALVAIGKGRLSELAKLEMPYRLREAIIRHSSDKAIGSLPENDLMLLLRSPFDAIRKVTSLKAIRTAPKRRIDALLKAYLSDGQRYYNVLYWLDFGSSLPKARVLAATQSVLSKS
jgi:hypothetical protein